MTKRKLTFSVNLHDKDGDAFEKGIYLHDETGMILQFDDIVEFQKYANDILGMVPEILDTHPDLDIEGVND